jgi:hypothetical protein
LSPKVSSTAQVYSPLHLLTNTSHPTFPHHSQHLSPQTHLIPSHFLIRHLQTSTSTFS